MTVSAGVRVRLDSEPTWWSNTSEVKSGLTTRAPNTEEEGKLIIHTFKSALHLKSLVTVLPLTEVYTTPKNLKKVGQFPNLGWLTAVIFMHFWYVSLYSFLFHLSIPPVTTGNLLHHLSWKIHNKTQKVKNMTFIEDISVWTSWYIKSMITKKENCQNRESTVRTGHGAACSRSSPARHHQLGQVLSDLRGRPTEL